MATQGQFNNRIKVMVVAIVAKEFRKAKIIERIVDKAKQEGHVASGKLTNPQKSRSLTPFSDDRWLIRKDAVKISSQALPSGEFAVTNVTVRVRYGLNGKYQNLSERFASGKTWFPPPVAIAQWIKRKKQQGQFTDVAEKDIKKVAFAIARSQEAKGIKKTKFANAFFHKQTGVKATLARGINKAIDRLDAVYGASITNVLQKIINL